MSLINSRSLIVQIVFASLLPVLIMFALISINTTHLIKSAALKNLQTNVQQTSETLNLSISPQVSTDNLETLHAYIDALVLEENNGILYLVIEDPYGKILVQSEGIPDILPPPNNDFIEFPKDGIAHVKQRILLEDGQIGSLRFGLNASLLSTTVTRIQQQSFMLMLGGILLILTLSTVFIKKIRKHFNKLQETGQSFAQGNYMIRAPEGGPKELACLAKVFNQMADAINNYVSSLKNSEERFDLAMQGANDGLWDWNLMDKSVFLSPRWKNMLGYEEDELENAYTTWERLIDPQGLEKTLPMLDECISGQRQVFDIEYRMLHKDGHWVEILSRGKVVHDKAGNPVRMVGTHVDISERKHAEQQLSYQARHDNLTDLINRYEFERTTKKLLDQLRDEPSENALCFLDLDQFKIVNDTCGHMAGDKLLQNIAELMKGIIRQNDVLARLGGDEFAILMKNCTIEQAQRVAQLLIEKIGEYQFLWDGQLFRIGASLGLVRMNSDDNSFDDLLMKADAACYAAKDLGRNRFHTYLPEDSELALREGEMRWIALINEALDQDRFCLYAQPIESPYEDNSLHYELLIRMLGENEVIPPASFIAAAERYGIMGKLDHWVITHTFKKLKANPGFLEHIEFISINLSGQSLSNDDTLLFITTELKILGINPGKICFEITETVAISNLAKAQNFINTLQEVGCLFALDDFGSGLSSFAYLKNLPANFLKIDGVFVKDMVDDPIDYAMVKAIHEVGAVMQIETIAEYVENDDIKKLLMDIGVNYVQGYGIGKPIPFDDLLEEH